VLVARRSRVRTPPWLRKVARRAVSIVCVNLPLKLAIPAELAEDRTDARKRAESTVEGCHRDAELEPAQVHPSGPAMHCWVSCYWMQMTLNWACALPLQPVQRELEQTGVAG